MFVPTQNFIESLTFVKLKECGIWKTKPGASSIENCFMLTSTLLGIFNPILEFYLKEPFAKATAICPLGVLFID